ncbi:guanine deaminase [Edwardsiella ictaluri]|uniref:Guanine deaminase n=2 Tax=Edwardsiella ictaluri TaxID=67780 RepID=A0ABY8GLD9_EDWIC|nr:guanine deaminase [Edwardsiella ictaluri]AVZ81466.1 guanine deaminase [Edwardsiella ictaluri]EKS7764290.1 guanine deaminase [Edwardsiella ictaluri]EKS7771148.1 guanine deaminase [Edwardsiella ictaluri]EKS7777574.1 guanine deaminase [Edwardsiella ictaluri]EKS7787712.1 guanine deaminase [Edwardsiella ictaluri]
MLLLSAPINNKEAILVHQEISAIRSSFLHFFSNPAKSAPLSDSFEFIEDGLLIIKEGKVVECRPYHHSDVHNYKNIDNKTGCLITPGFIDTHIHYPQSEMIGAYGEQLLEWLEKYTFPTEKKFADPAYAQYIAHIFINELLRNGTTTALVFGTVHPQSVDALFEEALSKNMLLISGKVMMDRNAPDYLLDTAESAYQDSERLIQKWHNRGRLKYAITPRFAPTSTPEQLRLAGELKEKYPDTYVHTHLCENRSEIAWVNELYPEQKSYFQVYRHYGLAGKKSVFAHAIHLSDTEWDGIAQTDSAIAFCPTSNLFLGSGLFNLARAQNHHIRVGLGTDIGAGTSFCQLDSLSEAYKVTQLAGGTLSAFMGFYLATLGGAVALSLDTQVGNFTAGKTADFTVIDWYTDEIQRLRMDNTNTLEDRLFALMILGGKQNIRETYIAGEKQYQRA